ncbi:MAG TPA: hypothetical protein VFN37_05190 [Candidatus Baltobacteraceae bacterium]|nr:hypothetical protein [Candidatus Baltobacteraceae bacterium]
MREVRESIALDVPAAQAEQCILEFIERHRRDNAAIEFPLRVSLEQFGVPGGLRLERMVNVHVTRQRDAQNLNDEIGIRWDPGTGEPFPAFSGSLTVWSEQAQTFVELRGTYEPPLGAAGKMFDDAIGHIVAQRTAHQFLLTLAQGAQACFQR